MYQALLDYFGLKERDVITFNPLTSFPPLMEGSILKGTSEAMIGKRSWSQKRKLEGEKNKHFHTNNFVLQAAVAVAQSVERPESGPLLKVTDMGLNLGRGIRW